MGSEIGGGGYGRIYEGPEGVVYKTARGRWWNLSDEAIIQEGAALQVLAGTPGIIEIKGFGVCDRRPYLVLPRIRAPTMDLVRLAWPASLATFVLVALAIREGHGRGIVHRDIKPSNIFVTDTGPVVFDYGLCAIRNQPELPVREGYFLGTPNVIPPELIAEETPDPRPEQDYYQLGVLLHWMCEHEYPIPGRTTTEVLKNAVVGVVGPMTVRPELQDARNLLLGPRDFDAALEAITQILIRELPPEAPCSTESDVGPSCATTSI